MGCQEIDRERKENETKKEIISFSFPIFLNEFFNIIYSHLTIKTWLQYWRQHRVTNTLLLHALPYRDIRKQLG